MHSVAMILGLLAAVALLVGVAHRVQVPYPVLLVLGGVALALVPGLPAVEMRPDLIFTLVLPPLLYSASWDIPWRDFRANLRPITLLAVGLVLVTAAAVALVARWVVPGMPWGVAFVLGAVVAPTDEVAALPVIERLAVPRRIAVVVQGESLLCDGTALVLYRMAIAAVVTGTFSTGTAVLQFFLVSVGGVLIGLANGWLVVRLFSRLDDPPVEITLSLLAPFAAYCSAEALGLSSVIAVMAMGIYVGRHSPRIYSPETRIQARAFWEMMVFLVDGILFLLVGLELRRILQAAAGTVLPTVAAQCLAVILTVIVVRVIWVFSAVYLPRVVSARLRERDPAPTWPYPALIAWTGIRGAMSLAAALAVPLAVRGGAPFPFRDRIIAVAFGVILVTLLLHGLTLRPLIQKLGIHDDVEEREENTARLRIAEAALDCLEPLAARVHAPEAVAEHLRHHYEQRLHRDQTPHRERPDRAAPDSATFYRQLRRDLLEVERAELVRLRDEGTISDTVMDEIEEELDHEAVRLDGRTG